MYYIYHYLFIYLFMRKKHSCVSTNQTDPVFNARLCYFLSVKMQNKKKVKHRPSTKYLYFHTITGPTLFFSGEKKNVSPTYRPILFFFFSAC